MGGKERLGRKGEERRGKVRGEERRGGIHHLQSVKATHWIPWCRPSSAGWQPLELNLVRSKIRLHQVVG